MALGTGDQGTGGGYAWDDLHVDGTVYYDVNELTGDGTTEIDFNVSNKIHLQLGAQDEVLTFVDPRGPSNFLIRITQDSVGDRDVDWPDNIYWLNGVVTAHGNSPRLSFAGDSIDFVGIYFDGTNYFGTLSIKAI